MYSIVHNYHSSIIKITLSDVLTFEDIKSMTIDLSKIKDSEILLLTDIRNAIFDFTISDFSKINEIIAPHTIEEIQTYEALLIDSPKETAISTLFGLHNQSKNHIKKIFSTEKAAISWLMFFKK